MNRRQKIIVSVTGIFLVLLIIVGLTYAYFLTKINGNENTKSISVSTANLALVYGDGNGTITGTNILPGTTLDEKTFTVTNKGNAETDYVVVIEDVKVTYAENVNDQVAGASTTFESNDFVYTLTCTSDGEACDGSTETTFPITGGILVGNSIEVGKTHTYSLTVTYKETGVEQSSDMNKILSAKVDIEDIKNINPYSDNTSSLAYNIINNAIVGKTGTTLESVPETIPAVSISGAISTGEYAASAMVPAMMPYGFGPWLYADTEDNAQNGTSASGLSCSDLVGKYIYDRSSSFSGVLKVESCEEEVPVVNQEIFDYENVLSVTQDDLGTSYYYRGQVEDNYLTFNNMCWRIVRIEGDGAIKLVLEDADEKCEDSDGNYSIGNANYGYTNNYVTNSSGDISSTKKYVADYVNGETNTENSMKYKLTAWLTSSGIDTNKLKKDNWCLGNNVNAYDTTGNLLSNIATDLIYSNTSFYYETYKRLKGLGTTAYATLKCNEKNHQIYKSYIGALTADEIVFAGGKLEETNGNFYLVNNAFKSPNRYFTLSILKYNNGDYILQAWGDGTLREYDSVSLTSSEEYIRPSITLMSNISINKGNGTKNNPYVIE